MNVDRILQAFNDCRVDYILIGGMNFLFRHAPRLTFDVDVWIDDRPENRDRCEKALVALDAQWGESDCNWGPVAGKKSGWLSRQAIFCMTSPHGSIDVFRSVKGLESWSECRRRAVEGRTAAETCFAGLSDADMLACQTALPEAEQNLERIRMLRQALEESSRGR